MRNKRYTLAVRRLTDGDTMSSVLAEFLDTLDSFDVDVKVVRRLVAGRTGRDRGEINRFTSRRAGKIVGLSADHPRRAYTRTPLGGTGERTVGLA